MAFKLKELVNGSNRNLHCERINRSQTASDNTSLVINLWRNLGLPHRTECLSCFSDITTLSPYRRRRIWSISGLSEQTKIFMEGSSRRSISGKYFSIGECFKHCCLSVLRTWTPKTLGMLCCWMNYWILFINYVLIFKRIRLLDNILFNGTPNNSRS